MRTLTVVLIWLACVVAGAALGFFAGYALWKLGFELIGSAVAWAGAAVGGIAIFLWMMQSDFMSRFE